MEATSNNTAAAIASAATEPDGAAADGAADTCWAPTPEEPYLKAPAAIFAVAVFCMNVTFAISSIKFNKSMSRLGLMMTIAFFINSAVPWLARALLFLLQELLAHISEYICVTVGLLCVISLHFQACLLSAIAHDRAQLICKPLTSHSLLLQRRPLLMFFICLAAPLLIIVPTLARPVVFCIDSLLGCIGTLKYMSILGLIGLSGIGALQWSCTVWYIVSYVLIWRTAKHVARQPHLPPSLLSGRRTALRTLSVLGVQHLLFVIAPNIIAAAIYAMMNTDLGTRAWMLKGMSVAFAGNDVVAPVVYVCFDRSLKEALRKLCCRRDRRPSNTSLASTRSRRST